MKPEPSDALKKAHTDRAETLLCIFEEIRNEFGREAAVRILTAASKRRGTEMGIALREFAPNDVEGLCTAYLEIPGLKDSFSPVLYRSDPTGFDVKLMRCPLKEAWLAAGVGNDDLADLTCCAAAADVARFESAGFDAIVESWRPGSTGCCRLHVRPRAEN